MKKNIIRYFTVLMLGGVSVASGSGSAQDTNFPDLSSLQDPVVVSQFLDRVDAVIQMLDDENIDVARVMSVAQEIKSRAEFDLAKEAGGKTSVFSPAARSRAAKELLSPKCYLSLENACIKCLASGSEDVRLLSMQILSQSLGSNVGIPRMSNILNENMHSLAEGGELSVSANELFATAENLAYLKDSGGVEVLESVLRSDASPSSLKCRAIKALNYLGIPLLDKIEADLLLSNDAAVAYTAFDSIGLETTNRAVISAAIRQLQVLKADYETKQMLSPNQGTLLVKISTMIKIASRKGILSADQREGVKTTVNFLADVQDENIQGRTGALFAELANDEDIDLIGRLLRSDSPRVRSSAALALSQCSSETIHGQRDVLIRLLNDDSAEVRNFALYALRKGLGEKTGNYLSDTEFETQKRKVIENYRKKN